MHSQPPPRVIGWRLYYGDGSIVDSHTDWADAPLDGVQVLVVFYDGVDKYGRPLKGMYHGSPGNAGDYYWRFGAGHAGEIPPDSLVKYGSMIEKDKWLAVYNAALGDYKWP